MRAQVQAALPENVSVDRFIRTVMTAVQVNPTLMEADRSSVLAASLEAATDGLIPDGREGAIVPYRTKGGKVRAQWQPMVWGLVALVRRSGELLEINPGTIYDGEEFEHWVDEDGVHFKHRPTFVGRGSPVAVYAFARTRDGGRYLEVMGWDEIEKFRSKSKATAEGTPWAEWTEQMAQARAIKRLCKRLPMRADAIDAIRRDDEREAGIISGSVAEPKRSPISMINSEVAGEPVSDEPTEQEATNGN
jgi:recombination protein RecT